MSSYACKIPGCPEIAKGELCPEHLAQRREFDRDLEREEAAKEREEEYAMMFQRENRSGDY